MKPQFDPAQAFQRRAWESAVGVFGRQKLTKVTFTMPSTRQVDSTTEQIFSAS